MKFSTTAVALLSAASLGLATPAERRRQQQIIKPTTTSLFNVFTGAASFLFYATLITVAGIGFGLVARRYVSREFFRAA